MPDITVQPFILNDCLLTVGEDNYEAHVSKVQFDPTAPVVRWKGLTPASSHIFGGASEWTCGMDYAQDWTTPNSLSAYLHANEGKPIDVVFKPLREGTPSIAATIIVAPGSIGGTVDQVATASITVASTKPVIDAA